MADSTTVTGIPFPEGPDANDVPADMQALAERVDEVPGIESLTSAQISALTAGQKPAGRVVYNSTTSKLQVSNGTTFADVDAAALLKAGGTMSGAIAMGNNKVTGLAAGTTAGDAVRYEQALLLAGGTMSGNINANGNKVTGLAAATTNGDAVRYEQALLLAGGTMAGAIAMGSNKITGLAAGTTAGDAVRYEQLAATDASVAALGTWTAWTPSLTSSGTTPTFANITDESRYTQIGKTVTGKGQVTITAVGTGTYRLPLPVTPKSTATAARRIGFIQIDGGGRVGHYSLEQANGATYCLAVEVGQITPVAYIDATFAGYYLAYGSPVRLSWDFTYEAA